MDKYYFPNNVLIARNEKEVEENEFLEETCLLEGMKEKNEDDEISVKVAKDEENKFEKKPP